MNVWMICDRLTDPWPIAINQVKNPRGATPSSSACPTGRWMDALPRRDGIGVDERGYVQGNIWHVKTLPHFARPRGKTPWPRRDAFFKRGWGLYRQEFGEGGGSGEGEGEWAVPAGDRDVCKS